MNRFLKPPGGIFTAASLGFLVMAGILSSISIFGHGPSIDLLLAVIALGTAVGLWLRHGWARWLGVAILALQGIESTVELRSGGQNTALNLTALALCAAVGWRLFKARKKETSLTALVWLLREPRSLDKSILEKLVEMTWGYNFAEEGNAVLAGGPPLPSYIASTPAGDFLINYFQRPYFYNSEQAAASVTELRLQGIIEKHQGWISVDQLGPAQSSSDEIYRHIGNLMAGLAGDDCLALLDPKTGRLAAYDDPVVEALKTSDPLQAFKIDTFSPVMKAPDDNTKLVESEAEARRRWPEFEEAMKQKRGQDFVVKAPITVGDNTEFIWINVQGLAADEIHGTLENEPMNLEGLRHGSKVIVNKEVVSDWAYSREGELQGFFSKEVFLNS